MRSTASSGENFLARSNNVKVLRIRDGLVEELSRCLRLEDAEDPVELLSELQELNYLWRDNTSDAIAPFIDARQNTGRPVTLVRIVL
jgi:hypothetical protein